MFPLGPTPFENAAADVTVDGVPIMVTRDDQGNIDYTVNDPERFADKISTGDLSYADFNPYENGFAKSRFDGTYGLRRFTDAGDEQTTSSAGYTQETSNVDARFGPAFLAPQVTVETLPASVFEFEPIWIGEWSPAAGSVSGPVVTAVMADTLRSQGRVIYFDSTVWRDSGYLLPYLPTVVLAAAGELLIAYSAAHTAQFITTLDASVAAADVTNTNNDTLYFFAGTVDRAALYIAGGTSTSDVAHVSVISAPLSATTPATQFALDSAAVMCGDPSDEIVAMAPGGGIAVVFILKLRELGEIAEIQTAGLSTTAAVYQALVPFETDSFSEELVWAMGRSTDQQRGPTVLAFGRDDSPWTYTPSSQDSGQASNIAPWAKRGFRPPNIRGTPGGFQGTARYLYYWVNRIIAGTLHSYLLCHDGQSGETLALLDLYALGFQGAEGGKTTITGDRMYFSLFGSNAQIGSIHLSADGSCPLDDTLATYALSGTLDEPAIAHGFPDEDKVEFTIRLVHDNLLPGAQDIAVWVSIDGGPYKYLGNAGAGSSSSVKFATPPVVKRLAPRFVLSTTDPNVTPVLLAYSVRASINPLLYREWVFTGEPATHLQPTGAPDLQSIYAILQQFWADRRAGTPVTYKDRWGDTYTVRLLRFKEQHIKQEPHMPPTVRLSFDLLEVSSNAVGMIWDSPTAVWDSSAAVWG